MEGWREYSLADLGEILNAKRIPLSSTERINRKGIYPYYGASGIIDYIDDYIFEGEHVLISEDGENLRSRNTPIAFFASDKFWVNNHAHIFKGHARHINVIIRNLLNSIDLNEYITGAAQPKLNKESLLRIPILLPIELKEQQAIAAVLSSLDDKIDLLHLQNKTLEALAQTLFRQWFVEEADSGVEASLSDFAENIRENVTAGNLNMFNNYIGLEHIEKKQMALYQHGNPEDIASNKSKFLGNDILFGKLRPYFHKVTYAPFDGICSTDILVIRPLKEEFFAFCLCLAFSDDFVQHSDIGSEGTRMPRTNWNILSGYRLPKPDLQRIRDFNVLVMPSITKMTKNISQIHTLTKLRDTLLPKLMSGEVRVSI